MKARQVCRSVAQEEEVRKGARREKGRSHAEAGYKKRETKISNTKGAGFVTPLSHRIT